MPSIWIRDLHVTQCKMSLFKKRFIFNNIYKALSDQHCREQTHLDRL